MFTATAAPAVPLAVALGAFLVWPLAVCAINLSLTNLDIERALKLARSPEKDRGRFHARYLKEIDHPVVRQIEVITEFRRLVLITEDRLRFGDWLFAQGLRRAQEALRPWRGRLTIAARFQFDPLNAYVTVPPFVLFVGGTPAIDPLDAQMTPQSSPPFETKDGVHTYLVGATIEAHFDSATMGQTVRPVSVILNGHELARATIDFAGLE